MLLIHNLIGNEMSPCCHIRKGAYRNIYCLVIRAGGSLICDGWLPRRRLVGAWIRVRGTIDPDAGPLFCVNHDKCQSARPFGVGTESPCGKPLHALDVTGDYSHPDVSAAMIGAITTPPDLADL